MGISETLGSSYRAAIEHEPPLVCVREPPYKHAPPTHSPRTCWPSYDHVPAKDQQTSKNRRQQWQKENSREKIADFFRKKILVNLDFISGYIKAALGICKGSPLFTHPIYTKIKKEPKKLGGKSESLSFFSFHFLFESPLCIYKKSK